MLYDFPSKHLVLKKRGERQLTVDADTAQLGTPPFLLHNPSPPPTFFLTLPRIPMTYPTILIHHPRFLC